MALEKYTIAITGANGYIGSYLVDYFHRKDYRVIALIRHTPKVKQKGVDYIHFDLTTLEHDFIPPNCNVLIHCAYIKHPAGSYNLDGTRALYQSAQKVGVKRFVFISSLSAYEGANSRYGKEKLAIEKLLNPHIDLVLKPGLVLGNGGLFGRILKVIQKSPVLPFVGNGRHKFQGIDIEDFAKCLEVAIDKGIVGVYPLVADKEFTFFDVAQFIRGRTRRRVWFIYVPFQLVNWVLSFFEILRIPFPVNKENLLGLKKNITWPIGDAVRVFGITPRPYTETLDSLLQQEIKK